MQQMDTFLTTLMTLRHHLSYFSSSWWWINGTSYQTDLYILQRERLAFSSSFFIFVQSSCYSSESQHHIVFSSCLLVYLFPFSFLFLFRSTLFLIFIWFPLAFLIVLSLSLSHMLTAFSLRLFSKRFSCSSSCLLQLKRTTRLLFASACFSRHCMSWLLIF